MFAQNYCVHNIVLISAICQHESATGTHMPPSSGTSFPPPTSLHPLVVTEHRFELPASYGKFPLATCVTYGSVYVSVLQALIQILPGQWDLSWPFNLKFQLSSKVSYWYSFFVVVYFYLLFPTFYSFNLFFVCLSYKDLSSIRICIFLCFVHSWNSSI